MKLHIADSRKAEYILRNIKEALKFNGGENSINEI